MSTNGNWYSSFCGFSYSYYQKSCLCEGIGSPSPVPSAASMEPTSPPTVLPAPLPTSSTLLPSWLPTLVPSSSNRTFQPTGMPTATRIPTSPPTSEPSTSSQPTGTPSMTFVPTWTPPTPTPTTLPNIAPSAVPTQLSFAPTLTEAPTLSVRAPDHSWDFRGCANVTVQDLYSDSWARFVQNGSPDKTAICAASGIALSGNNYVEIDSWVWGGATSVEVFVKCSAAALQTKSRVFDFGADATSTIFLSQASYLDGRGRFGVLTSSSSGATTTGHVWEANHWVHVIVTAGSEALQIFKDGALVSERKGGQLPNNELRRYHYLGKSVDSKSVPNYFSGSVAYIRFYHNLVLTPSNVAQLYAAALAECPPGNYIASGSCEPCPMGTSSAVFAATGISKCTACAPGTYAPIIGADNCTICPEVCADFSCIP